MSVSDMLAAEFVQSMSLPGVNVLQIDLINLAKNLEQKYAFEDMQRFLFIIVSTKVFI